MIALRTAATARDRPDSRVRELVMRVLYTHAWSLIGGGNKVLLRLFNGLDRRRFQPISVITLLESMQALSMT